MAFFLFYSLCRGKARKNPAAREGFSSPARSDGKKESSVNHFQQLENAVLLWFQSVRTDALTAVLVPYTNLGDHGALWIGIAGLLLCFRRTRRAGACALCSLGVCFLVTNVWLKPLLARARPYTVLPGLLPIGKPLRDASFPSGHTTAAFACATACRRSLRSRFLRGLLLCMAVLMALSRLYVGVHYPSDVLAGALVGTLGSSTVCRLLRPGREAQALRGG